jgi:hypothetical protein
MNISALVCNDMPPAVFDHGHENKNDYLCRFPDVCSSRCQLLVRASAGQEVDKGRWWSGEQRARMDCRARRHNHEWQVEHIQGAGRQCANAKRGQGIGTPDGHDGIFFPE